MIYYTTRGVFEPKWKFGVKYVVVSKFDAGSFVRGGGTIAVLGGRLSKSFLEQ